MRVRIFFNAVCMPAFLAFSTASAQTVATSNLEAANYDSNSLRMNQIQVIGTHNSYHVRPEEPLFSQIKAVYPDAATWDYSHAPLDIQLERSVRSFELDVYHDPHGTKVLHVPEFDSGTTCETLVDGLKTIRAWSSRSPQHVPVIILVELKDGPVPQTQVPILPFDKMALDQLDAEIRSVFDSRHLLTPDDVRGGEKNLSEAIRAKGWPLLDSVRGKVMFVLHARGRHAELYTEGSPSLEGRAMFLESQEGKPFASVFIRNNPHDESIAKLVHGGYIVRTRADSGLTGQPGRLEAAIASGAHIISTDFPNGEPHSETAYVAVLPDAVPARLNPLNGISKDE